MHASSFAGEDDSSSCDFHSICFRYGYGELCAFAMFACFSDGPTIHITHLRYQVNACVSDDTHCFYSFHRVVDVNGGSFKIDACKWCVLGPAVVSTYY